jgi:putative mycofactocin binding protein MftB
MTRVELDEAWALSESVALRPEPFGALAYHFGNRKLTFLKRPELVAVVTALAASPDVRSALREVGIPESQYAAYAAALSGLADSDMLQRRTAEADDDANHSATHPTTHRN